jgi:hypothetical protein
VTDTSKPVADGSREHAVDWLAGRTAIVVGASRGLGRGTVTNILAKRKESFVAPG